jgi:alkanesulfonate monooxygenase SsuD/methylene tetrahydromethanopterin reductase-like flavin-dependent oxidoreductase (luciferase family)
LAGEVADGFHVHPLHTPRYLTEVLLPAINRGATAAGRPSNAIKISTTAFVVTSPEEELFVRAQIAFYASTPSYRRVMALHGWEAVAQELSALAARGNWGEMPGLIDDTMLSTFAIVTDIAGVKRALLEKYGALVDRLGLYLPFVPGEREDLWRAFLSARE